jgi:2-polyprenyl-3-methyl-5-hydroxy-6-metoxy-1,4-benzoquinol methylase
MADTQRLAQAYSQDFFAQTSAGSVAAARRVLPLLWRRRAFRSVVDVGCGTGGWLAAAGELGASVVQGVDGPHVPPEMLMIEPTAFRAVDLEATLGTRPGEKYDLCLCLEVAEHLSVPRGLSLVAELAALSDTILFSAAIPYQGGTDHVNEMWPEYWAVVFASTTSTPGAACGRPSGTTRRSRGGTGRT